MCMLVSPKKARIFYLAIESFMSKGEAKMHARAAKFVLAAASISFLSETLKSDLASLLCLAKVVDDQKGCTETTEDIENATKHLSTDGSAFCEGWGIYPGFVTWKASIASFTKQKQTESMIKSGTAKLVSSLPTPLTVTSVMSHADAIAAQNSWLAYVEQLVNLKSHAKGSSLDMSIFGDADKALNNFQTSLLARQSAICWKDLGAYMGALGVWLEKGPAPAKELFKKQLPTPAMAQAMQPQKISNVCIGESLVEFQNWCKARNKHVTLLKPLCDSLAKPYD